MMTHKKVKALFLLGILAIGAIALSVSTHVYASSVSWTTGDVFVGVSNGTYKVYDNTGAFKDTISDGQGGFTTGCAFNGTLDKLYTTNFSNTKVEVYDNAIPHTLSQTIDTGVINPGGHSESIVFAANGDFYVGHPDGNKAIQRYSSAGVYQQSYTVATENRGSDWMDLASDQKTMFYTSEGGLIKRFDVSGAGTQLADFASIGGVSFALRLLPPGDGTGGLLVAHSTDIERLDGAGTVVKTYAVAGEASWFSLNLDPNGTSFWAGDFTTGDFFRFNIATGAVEVGPINTGTGASTVFGICVKGELTAAQSLPGRMTGGGTIGDTGTKHGFELHCDITQSPNNLEVNWGKGNKFHLDTLSAASCSDDPNITPNPPAAGLNNYTQKGTGTYNGVAGATAEWTFTDAGEPGTNDTATIKITDVNGNIVLNVSGKLSQGNQQAHNP